MSAPERPDRWCTARVQRMSYLVDGQAYFGALAWALERAQRQVVMLGWDFDTRIRLRRGSGGGGSGGGGDGDTSETLQQLLERVLRQRPRLHVYMLAWDYPLAMARGRQRLPKLFVGLLSHPRLHYAMDGCLPAGASHHQKAVVVDAGPVGCTLGFPGRAALLP